MKIVFCQKVKRRRSPEKSIRLSSNQAGGLPYEPEHGDKVTKLCQREKRTMLAVACRKHDCCIEFVLIPKTLANSARPILPDRPPQGIDSARRPGTALKAYVRDMHYRTLE
ncbi:hypothetical protein [Martelella soudanensis]|uniref:hypothetical protein n=1 Tax=unclassified Martelella TaxID=2629616 RepID=UPI0015DF9129|nr:MULTISPECIES: hypothetical protein [unclassified Martelella]